MGVRTAGKVMDARSRQRRRKAERREAARGLGQGGTRRKGGEGVKWPEEEMEEVQSQEAGGLQGPWSPPNPSNRATLVPQRDREQQPQAAGVPPP